MLININQNNPNAFYVRGCAYEKLDQVERAIQDFTIVLELDPEHVNAAYARGAAENKRGNYIKAIEDYNMALSLDTKDRHLTG